MTRTSSRQLGRTRTLLTGLWRLCGVCGLGRGRRRQRLVLKSDWTMVKERSHSRALLRFLFLGIRHF